MKWLIGTGVILALVAATLLVWPHAQPERSPAAEAKDAASTSDPSVAAALARLDEEQAAALDDSLSEPNLDFDEDDLP